MIKTIPRWVVARLPDQWQREIRRLNFRLRIRRGTFESDEPEFDALASIVRSGDWVIDVGANVGFYTKRMAELVGRQGRVLAFEPVPETFVVLANNLESSGCTNVSLFNAAVSEETGIAGMSIPRHQDTGLQNFYQAHLSEAIDCELQILVMSVDSMQIPHTIRLVKIDAEGHEFSVLKGMRKILTRDRPILIVETPNADVSTLLKSLGYAAQIYPGSPNTVFFRDDVEWDALIGRQGADVTR
jgi:FkbM family methyltransferase